MDFKFELVDLVLVSPMIILFLASLLPLTVKVLRGNREPASIVTMSYGVLGLICAGVGVMIAQQGFDRKAFEGALVFDGLGQISALVILFATAVTLILSRENLASSGRQFSEFTFLLLNAAIGMLTVVWANDLIILFIGIELTSLSSYILIALSNERRLSKESAFKYFILGSFASGILLYGMAFIYGTVGATYLPEITAQAADLMATNRLFLFGVVLLVVGLCFKVSVFPFHAWTPDVYQGAPTPISGFMATAAKAALLIFFLRFMATHTFLVERSVGLVNVLQWFAILTILVGNIAAVIQTNVKRMLAYSSVAHSGYVLIGLIVAGVGGANGFLGAASVGYYVVAYSLMTLGAFAVVSYCEQKEESSLSLSDLDGFASKSPVMALCLTVFLLSLAGIPPLVGFFGKFFIFSAAINQGFWWLAFWGVIGSVIAVYYYLRPIVGMYMKPSAATTEEPAYVGKLSSQLVIAICAALVVLTGLIADPLFERVLSAVKRVFV